jgi:Cu2+-exporting ATPase
VLLDKTGTVTRGRPVLADVVPLDPAWTRDAALRLAAAVERRSEHHVGRAVADAARGLGPGEEPEVTAFQAVPGRGVEARVGRGDPGDVTLSPREARGEGRGEGRDLAVLAGNRALLAERGVPLPPEADRAAAAREARGETVAFLAVDGRAAALLAVTDVVRDEAAEAVARLRDLGLSLAIVSGDARATTAAVASALGLPALAEVTPQGKRDEVARRQREGRRVLFVGDGLNDAPALTQADVGASMGRGADVTMESADAVLVRDDLRLLPELLRLSRRTTRVIRQNLFWAFFYNLVAVPLAVAGVLHPIVAAGAMAASSLFVVGNSARLGRG